MFKHRQILPKGETVVEAKPILQVMQTVRIMENPITGKLFLVDSENPQWETIPTEYVDNEEYDKARGYKMPEVCEGKNE